ncbi:hypothetical protein EVAR_75613_1 [Eumeta japonica]|uniref:Uncharacterized protein n=1 Tax=Eumeta variegata TaxID=151549 RepID=A0A4C1TZX6_EUMVA|nr:hypothetical protein EVAR_75613_1 [Eumeta japonica]
MTTLLPAGLRDRLHKQCAQIAKAAADSKSWTIRCAAKPAPERLLRILEPDKKISDDYAELDEELNEYADDGALKTADRTF